MHVAEGLADCGRGVLGVIAEACGAKGVCTLFQGQIAHKVGCTVETVRLTMRWAERRGLITTMHRRVGRDRNLANVVTIRDEAWRQWIARGLKGAAKRVGAELRTRAQSAIAAYQHRKDARAAAAALRIQRQADPARCVDSERTPKASAPSPESSFQEETPRVASQPREEKCPNGSLISGVGRAAAYTSPTVGG